MASSALPIALLSGAVIDLDGSLLLELGIFFAAFFLLRRFVFTPVLAVFDARDQAIDGAKRDAQAIEVQAEDKLKAFETEIKKVKVNAQTERDALHQDALALERDLLARARKDADEMLATAGETMRSESEKIRADMAKSVPSLAAELATKLLGRKAA